MTPDELLAVLKTKSPRQSSTLDAVYAVCQEQVDRGATDFSYSTISRLGAGRGVPRVQSIHNKAGENYRALIKCFEDSPGARKRVPRPKASDAWVEDIKDPKTKLMVNITLSKLREAEKLNRELIPPDTEFRVDDRPGTPTDFKLTSPERNAIEYLLSEDFLRAWNLEVGQRGTLVDSAGRNVFKPGTMDALKKVLKYL
jgi:hypothetical protein